jgi:phosphoglycerol transferase
VLVLALRLWHADLSVPLDDHRDALTTQLFIRTTLETGWYLDNARLGAPGALDLRDFPIADILHLGVIKLLGYVVHDPVVAMNLYALLPFPLTALSAYFVLRRLRLGRLTALVPAVLYACLPYHFLRMKCHLFLAAYYLLPLMVLLAVRVSLANRRFSAREAAGAVLVCVLTGLSGAYYAFFSCFFLLAAGIRASFQQRRAAPLGRAVVLTLIIAAALGAALAPSFLHFARQGRNPEVAARLPAEADMYGLTVAEMLLPIAGHRIGYLAELRTRYLAPPRPPTGEGGFASLGVVGAVGFLWLLGRSLWRRRDGEERVVDCLAYLNLAAVLLGTVGGLGACFNFLVTPMIRCYNRISVFIAFFALAGLFSLVQRLADRHAQGRRSRVACALGLGAVLLVGLYDQTSPRFVPAYAATREEFASDADFGRRMEAALPPGSMVYQMPFVPFPEEPPVCRLQDYELLRPYHHTQTLRWSYAAIRGREAGRWLADAAERPLPELLERLAVADFRGVYLDRAGFADNGAAVEAELTRILGAAPLVSLSGRQTFFDLTSYAEAFRSRFTDEQWRTKRDAVLHPVAFDWGGTFSPRERGPAGETWRWCGSEGTLNVSNPCSWARTIVLRMECSGWQDRPVQLVLDGSLGRKDLILTPAPQRIEWRLCVPPGEHVIRFSCDGPRVESETDPREIVFRVWNFQYHEEDSGTAG